MPSVKLSVGTQFLPIAPNGTLSHQVSQRRRSHDVPRILVVAAWLSERRLKPLEVTGESGWWYQKQLELTLHVTKLYNRPGNASKIELFNWENDLELKFKKSS